MPKIKVFYLLNLNKSETDAYHNYGIQMLNPEIPAIF